MKIMPSVVMVVAPAAVTADGSDELPPTPAEKRRARHAGGGRGA